MMWNVVIRNLNLEIILKSKYMYIVLYASLSIIEMWNVVI